MFANLRELRNSGHTLLFISHKLDEVLEIADDVTVMRRGTTVASVDPKAVTQRQLAELMVGSELPSPSTDTSTVTDHVQLSVMAATLTDTAGRNLLEDINLTIHRGEVVGVAGVEGNGQAELVETIMGMRVLTSGTVFLEDEEITSWPTRRRREAGIGYIPEDRQRHGLLLDSPLWENRILGHQTTPPNVKGLWVDRAGAQADSQRIIDEHDVRTPSYDTNARALSGGNQQKFIVGREMSGSPVLLLASHPTRGVDVGAQAAIWDHIREARRQGLAILLISADLDELIGLSDRIQVILRGRLGGDFDPQTVTPQELGSAMTGGGRGSPRDPTTGARRRGARARRVDCPGRHHSDPDGDRQLGQRLLQHHLLGARTAEPHQHRQQQRDPFPVRSRGRDRLPDEPLQHRRGGAVPRRRLCRRVVRRQGWLPGPRQHRGLHPGGHGGRRPVGRDRRRPQGHPRCQRGDLDDHAQCDRRLPDGLWPAPPRDHHRVNFIQTKAIPQDSWVSGIR